MCRSEYRKGDTPIEAGKDRERGSIPFLCGWEGAQWSSGEVYPVSIARGPESDIWIERIGLEVLEGVTNRQRFGAMSA